MPFIPGRDAVYNPSPPSAPSSAGPSSWEDWYARLVGGFGGLPGGMPGGLTAANGRIPIQSPMIAVGDPGAGDDMLRRLAEIEIGSRQASAPFRAVYDRRDIALTPEQLGRRRDLEEESVRRSNARERINRVHGSPEFRQQAQGIRDQHRLENLRRLYERRREFAEKAEAERATRPGGGSITYNGQTRTWTEPPLREEAPPAAGRPGAAEQERRAAAEAELYGRPTSMPEPSVTPPAGYGRTRNPGADLQPGVQPGTEGLPRYRTRNPGADLQPGVQPGTEGLPRYRDPDTGMTLARTPEGRPPTPAEQRFLEDQIGEYNRRRADTRTARR